jgi:hypothetical protein
LRRSPFRWSGLAAVLIVSAIALAPTGAVGAIERSVTVCPAGPPTCDYATIPEALDAVEDGDSIVVAAGSYAGGFTIDKSINLLGSGASQTTISGGDPAAVTISSEQLVTIESVTITDATYTGVVNDGTLTVRDSAISDNNRLGLEGVGVTAGGVLNDGTLTLDASSVIRNKASTPWTPIGIQGAAGIVNLGTATLSDCTLSANSAINFAVGGILSSGNLAVRNCTIDGNFSPICGGIENSGEALVADTSIRVNRGQDGGGIKNSGTLSMRRTVLSGNLSVGISNSGDATIADSTIDDNSGFHSSGGISNTGTMNLRRATVNGNDGDLGGIENGGSLTLRRTAVSDNGGRTGGIVNYGSLTLRHSIVSRNNGSGPYGAGGIANEPSGNALLVSSIVSDNTGVIGGGIANYQASLTLRHSIVTRNIATGQDGVFGGGIYNQLGTVLLRHSAVFGNIPDDCVGC